jgi:exodeoxyribonuclease VII large subunit
MTRVWQKNEVPIRAVLSPARVQGEGAAQDIVAAIERLNRHGEADVIIVGRGGGSREDLWSFNEEPVARAIADSAIPIVSGVGHEIDQTIADLVADQRAATPTAAAELVAPSRTALDDRLDAAHRRANAALSQRLLRARTRLQAASLQRRLRQPSRLLQVHRQRLDEAFSGVSARIDRRIGRSRRTLYDAARLLTARSPTTLALRRRARIDGAASAAQASMLRLLDQRKARLAAAVARVDALSPLAVLGRGYAICERRADGTIVRRAEDVAVGDSVSILLEQDALDCTVDAARKGTTRPPL